MSYDKILFKNKTLSDIFGEIYDNSKEKSKQISGLIGELKPLINEIGDATLVVPMIKEYLEIGVKNDEHLIKLAGIVQRLENSNNKGSDIDMFDPEEIQALLDEIESTEKEVKKINNKEEVIEEEIS